MALVSLGGERDLASGGAWVSVTHHLPPPGVKVEVDLGAFSCRAEIRQDEGGQWAWVFEQARGLPSSPIFGHGRLPELRVKRWRLLAPQAHSPVAKAV